MTKNQKTTMGKRKKKFVVNPKTKSKSRELREVLYRQWEAQMSGTMDFEEFYNLAMTQIISKEKSKINPYLNEPQNS